MTTSEIHEAGTMFLRYARVYLDVNALGPDWRGRLVREVMGLPEAEARELFLTGLAAAVSGVAVSARDYEIATGWAFDTEVEYRAHLREVWDAFGVERSPRDLLVE